MRTNRFSKRIRKRNVSETAEMTRNGRRREQAGHRINSSTKAPTDEGVDAFTGKNRSTNAARSK